MPRQAAKPRRILPAGLSDAIDGSDSFAGAMAQLANLIPQPNATGVWVPRPGMVQLAALPDYGGGPVSAMIGVGNMIYGVAPSAAFPGHDTPFSYNGATNTFLPISGRSAANLPVSMPNSMTPPTIAQVGTRVIFTHPGFAGGSGTPYQLNYPGSYDMVGNLTSGSPVITGNLNTQAGTTAGLPPVGSLIIGANIPVGTTVTAAALVFVNTTASGSSGANTIVVASAAGIQIGHLISAAGAAGHVTGIAGTTITLSQNNSATLPGGTAVQFIGSSITMSANATGTANNQLIGFSANGGAQRFGVLDLSGFSTSLITQSVAGSTIFGGGWNPQTLGIQPGMSVTGPGIPAGTVVVNANTFVVTGTASGSAGSSTLTIAAGGLSLNNFPIAYGYNVAGAGLATGTYVVGATGPDITNAYTLVLNQPAIGPVTGITISGGWVEMSNAATATVSSPATINVTVAGGTPSAPLWSSGDTAINPLAGTPVFVAQFANRAYFGINTIDPPTSGVTASDPNIPAQVTNANQVITFADNVPVTAAGGLPLYNQLGGIIQALIVFQGDANIRQITGDFALGTWAQNALNTATGTLSPRSVVSSPRGLLFAASDGLRLVDFDGHVTDPIGNKGAGILLPFQNCANPVATVAAYNENVYRMTITWAPPASVVSVWGAAVRTDEFWFHLAPLGQPLEASRWSGPHTSVLDGAAPLTSASTFVVAPSAARGFLYRSDPWPMTNSVYSEFGSQIACTEQTLLMPDDQSVFANSIDESTVFVGLTSGSEEILVTAIDDVGVQIDQAYVFVGQFSNPAQRAILWHFPLTFRQMRLRIQAGATPQLQLGAITVHERPLNYQLPYPVPQEFISGQDILGGPAVLGP